MSTSVSAPAAPASTGREQVPLLLARVVFALVWAVIVAVVAPGIGWGAAILLALYPLGDVVLVGLDARSAGSTARVGLAANAALSALAAVALALAATQDVPSVLRVWGAWAVVAGLGQLVVALSRRRVRRGQWPLVVSGALSVVVGVAFVVMAAGPAPELTPVAGYAVAGAVFALVGLLRLRHSSTAA
ncbi:hypothetical protein GCM10023201_21500 [Actinomycetospora corticicola]|uniref:DUF308 domain-containing protein n=1 Tax=Actinomycetospora corticicola TaxID=663602 RepID=A0A7Y9J3Y8_9PSEU|nr:DUF308 domain-containing protein [Actinomycetospora corticicola]NYD34134.1 hypothetical protein [Actinomycetospora corticicola]